MLRVGLLSNCTPPAMKTVNEHTVDRGQKLLEGNLFQHVAELSGLQRHTRNITDLNVAAGYIKDELERLGYKVQEQLYKGPPGDPNVYKNLIVSFGPENTKRIILGAHYDSEPQSQTPGADDNASGVAGVIEIARLLKEKNPKLKRRIDLVFYSTEEKPHCSLDLEGRKSYENFMGSAVHARYLRENNIPVVGALILEMIGYYSEARNSQRYPYAVMKLFYPQTGNYIGVIGDALNFRFVEEVKRHLKAGCKVDVRSLSVPSLIVPDILRSDHHSYYKCGYNGVMITDTADFRNENYHKRTDTPETLDYKRMAEVVKGIYNTVVNL